MKTIEEVLEWIRRELHLLNRRIKFIDERPISDPPTSKEADEELTRLRMKTAQRKLRNLKRFITEEAQS